MTAPADSTAAAPSRAALAVAAVGLAVVVIALAAPFAWVRSTHGNLTSSDEPHYLLTALSLGRDGDLDVANQAAAEDWRAFHEQGLRHQAAEDPDGRMVVPHDPLLPLVLALPMRWGGWLAARLTLAVVGGVVAALTLWAAVTRFGARLAPAVVVVGVLSGSATMAVYSSQLFPEILAALATVVAVLGITSPSLAVHGGEESDARGAWSNAPVSRRSIGDDHERGAKEALDHSPASRDEAGASGITGADLLVVLAVVALPWLAVKYAPVAAVLAGLHLARRWRTGGRTVVGWLMGLWLVAGALYVGAHFAWYGGLTAYAAGEFFRDNGSQLSVVGTDPSLPGRARRLVGLLVGRDFGIATWQPAWLLAVPAIVAMAGRWRARRGGDREAGGLLHADWLVLAAPVAAGWLVATFVALTMQGWWFPGRQLVVVLPLLAIALGVWASRQPVVLVATAVLGLAGVWTTVQLARDGLAERLALIVDFGFVDSWPLQALSRVMPDYLAITPMTWLLHGSWGVALVVACLGAWRSGSAAPGLET